VYVPDAPPEAATVKFVAVLAVITLLEMFNPLGVIPVTVTV
jgi:hypothetical protein